MKRIYKAPEDISNIDNNYTTIFLAGSIEMDKAVDWQKQCENELSSKYILFNPRRPSWNSAEKRAITNPYFKEQVYWELNALEKADIIIMFFAENTQSPISLLEFGLFAQSGKLKVVVEDNFWRKGNIDVVCEKYQIEQFQNINHLIKFLNK